MSSDNQDGIIWILGCLIVLTLSGVFLSILVDKRFTFQRERNTSGENLETGRVSIRELNDRIEESQVRLDASESTITAYRSKLDSHQASLSSITAETKALRIRNEELTASIKDTALKFDQYRENYRRAEWRNAAGEKIGHIFLKTGRQFDKVIISRVTPAGLEISHAHGTARIDFNDLGPAYHDRFQWNDDGRERELEKERLNRSVLGQPAEERKARHYPPPNREADADDAAINSARNAVRAGRSAVSTLRILHSEAVSNSRFGTQRSVPGSLRTWGEQAAILEKKLAAANAKLSLEIEKLRQISPGDALLRQVTTP